MSEPYIVAMIPARAGSERLKFKNLRLLGGKPVIQHAVETAKASDVFNRVVINSDHAIFSKIAERCGVEFYQRPEWLGSSEAKSDDVVADFMKAHEGDVLVWVNPIAPLQTPEEVRTVVDYFVRENFDSLITTENKQVHCLYDGKPLNFSEEGLFAKTQDLVPVKAFVYSLMMWRYETFLTHYEKHGYALMSGKVGYHSVHKDSTVILKYEEDLRMAEAILQARSKHDEEFHYDPIVDEI